jgi:hypothetical protein
MGFAKTSLPKELTTLKHKVCLADEETVEIIVELHCFFNDCKKVAQWLETKNPMFGNIAPLRLMQVGRSRKVLEFIMQANHERWKEEQLSKKEEL